MSKIVKQVCLKYFKLCSLFLVAFFFIVFCVNLMFLVKYRTEYFNPAFDFFFKVYTGLLMALVMLSFCCFIQLQILLFLVR